MLDSPQVEEKVMRWNNRELQFRRQELLQEIYREGRAANGQPTQQ